MEEPLIPPGTPEDDILLHQTQEQCQPCTQKKPAQLNNFMFNFFCGIHIICGVCSIGLGAAAYVLHCNYSNLFIPVIAGTVFVATGIIGTSVREYGWRERLYGSLSLASIMFGLANVVTIFSALTRSETDDVAVCDCPSGTRSNHCCSYTEVIYWDKTAVDVAIMVVGVMGMVASTLTVTLIAHRTDGTGICKSSSKDTMSNELPTTTTTTKGCCTVNRNIMMLSGFHILLGISSVLVGIWALFAECIFAEIALPIWSGLLGFCLTGVLGLLSVRRKGVYVSFFFSMGILSMIYALNIIVWMPITIHGFEEDEYECSYTCEEPPNCDTSWYFPPYTTPPSICSDCSYGCCVCEYYEEDPKDKLKFTIDKLTFGIAVTEAIVCLISLVLIITQIRCCCCDDGECCTYNNTQNNQSRLMTISMGVAVPQRNSQYVVVEHPLMMSQAQGPV